jgi:hypothetical protein
MIRYFFIIVWSKGLSTTVLAIQQVIGRLPPRDFQ